MGDDHIRFEADKLHRQGSKPADVPFRPTLFDQDIRPDSVAELAKPLEKWFQRNRRALSSGPVPEKTDPPSLLRLLRGHRQRVQQE